MIEQFLAYWIGPNTWGLALVVFWLAAIFILLILGMLIAIKLLKGKI